jgi:hypothetical protein
MWTRWSCRTSLWNRSSRRSWRSRGVERFMRDITVGPHHLASPPLVQVVLLQLTRKWGVIGWPLKAAHDAEGFCGKTHFDSKAFWKNGPKFMRFKVRGFGTWFIRRSHRTCKIMSKVSMRCKVRGFYAKTLYYTVTGHFNQRYAYVNGQNDFFFFFHLITYKMS